MSKAHRKKKRFFNSKQEDQNLKSYLKNQTSNHLREHNTGLSDHEKQQPIHQQFSLPLYGKHAYFYGFSMKYAFLSILTTLPFLIILPFFEFYLIQNFNLDGDQIIANYWWALLSLPIVILLCFIPITHKQKNLIANYVVTLNALHIIHSNQNLKVIEYKDIFDASSVYAGTGSQQFRISYLCQETKEIISNEPIFLENISWFNIYPIKNEYFLIASFLQQLRIHNPKASINLVDLYHYRIDPDSLQFDQKKYLLEKLFFKGFILFISLLTIFLLFFAEE